jgi:uncharacterized protein (DUF1810 family)
MNTRATDLARFVAAQENVYPQVVAELRAGRKRTHWMWFIFPQMVGLGQSFMSTHYGIRSLEEAARYIRHPVLGARLRECTKIMNGIEGKSAYEILGDVDEIKFKSSMTLFKYVGINAGLFTLALQKYFDGEEDHLTVDIIGDTAAG